MGPEAGVDLKPREASSSREAIAGRLRTSGLRTGDCRLGLAAGTLCPCVL